MTEVLEQGANGIVGRFELAGIGGTSEFPAVAMWTVADGLVERIEYWDEGDVDAARARLATLATAGEPESGLDIEPPKLIGCRAVCHR